MPSLSSAQENPKFTVLCICGGVGFPRGTATTKRIFLFGKCLASEGIPFHVYHIGPSTYEENTTARGECEGLSFEYLSPEVRRPDNRIKRALYYLWGSMLLPFRLLRRRHGTVAYICYQGDYLNLWALLLCRLMKIPAAQEACEWWPGTANSMHLNDWMYRRIMFRWSAGAIPISHEIQDRIRSLAGSGYPMCLVPVLVDCEEIGSPSLEYRDAPQKQPVLLWCGMVDGYKRDPLFLIDSLAALKSPVGKSAVLRIAGPCTDSCRNELLSYAASKNISPDRIDIVGYVSDEQLAGYCARAYALLMPLWPDDRSLTRFPTKMGQYLASGRPIVTARVGEIRHFLTGETAMFYPPGDAEGLASSLDRLLSDPNLGKRLADRATREILPRVDIRTNAPLIGSWFARIFSQA